MEIGPTRAQPGNKVWHLERAKKIQRVTLGGGGAILFGFTLWSVRWKDDQKRLNRCCLKPLNRTGVSNLFYCRAFVSRILVWMFYIRISVFKYLAFKSDSCKYFPLSIVVCCIIFNIVFPKRHS